MTNPADSFFGESSPSAKFDAIGTTVGGVITRIGDPMQQTDFYVRDEDTGEQAWLSEGEVGS